MVTRERLITAAEFERYLEHPDRQGRLFELIHGEIVEKMPTQEHGVITAVFIGELYIYLRQNPLGRLETEVRHRPLSDDYNDRLPDISIDMNLEQPIVKKGAVPGTPAFIVEVQSPDDSPKKMLDSAQFYLSNGAMMVVLIYTTKQVVEVLTATDRQLLTMEDTFTGGELLPGFSLSVKRIFGAE